VVTSGAVAGTLSGQERRNRDVECSADGTRIYFEEGVRQSQATPDGESVFSYVKLMDELLHRATNVLVLGCGGGNLATRLARLGKRLTIVDNNPVSFVIAQRYFGLPDGLPLMVSDFRKFILDDDLLYDGIAIDVGGPDFRFDDEFDVETCDAGTLTGWIDPALAIDVRRAARLERALYRVWTQTIPAAITPKNRLLLGQPEP
jgi:SAM-dependent methyltransferase